MGDFFCKKKDDFFLLLENAADVRSTMDHGALAEFVGKMEWLINYSELEMMQQVGQGGEREVRAQELKGLLRSFRCRLESTLEIQLW